MKIINFFIRYVSKNEREVKWLWQEFQSNEVLE